jgi:hypothetical protein
MTLTGIERAAAELAPDSWPKVLETGAWGWEIPTGMTVVADNKKRVTLRLAKPGDRFDVQITPGGKFVLTKLEPAKPRPNKARLIRTKQGYLVAVSERPITQEMVRAALDEFP